MNSDISKKLAELHSITEEEGEELTQELPKSSYVESLAELFQALSDPTRIRVLYLLSQKELCVHDLATLTGASQSAISHHLKTLKLNNLVKARREGKAVNYSLDDEHVSELFCQCLEHVEHQD